MFQYIMLNYVSLYYFILKLYGQYVEHIYAICFFMFLNPFQIIYFNGCSLEESIATAKTEFKLIRATAERLKTVLVSFVLFY